MKLYLADWEAANSLLTNTKEIVRNILTTYYYNKDIQFYKQMKLENKNVFLDSGAFSAWSQKKEINIFQYAQFLHKVKEYVEVYATLDSIGDYKKTMENTKYLESEGLSPLPCFHYGEPITILDKYVDKYEYIALGGMVPISTPQLMFWLDDIFHRHPKVKFHGFGLTTLFLIKRYPWYSVDSSSWCSGGKFERVIIKDRTFDFGRDQSSPDAWTKQSSYIQEYYKEILQKEYNITPEELFNSYKRRNDVNVLSFLQIEKELTLNPPKIFQKPQMEFFDISLIGKREEEK